MHKEDLHEDFHDPIIHSILLYAEFSMTLLLLNTLTSEGFRETALAGRPFTHSH